MPRENINILFNYSVSTRYHLHDPFEFSIFLWERTPHKISRAIQGKLWQTKMKADLISTRKVLTICPFVHLPKGKKCPNRCGCDVGTFIWRHQKNRKCKHISPVWECLCVFSVILLWWPKAISPSSYRTGISVRKGQDSLPYSISQNRQCAERYARRLIESQVC